MLADIDELDQLVAELLTYARFDRDKPVLKFQRQAIEPWLSEVIKQLNVRKKQLQLDYRIEGDSHQYAQFEPRLMARALGNLLQNAQRYAQSRIEVIFTQQSGHYCLIVDDDSVVDQIYPSRSVTFPYRIVTVLWVCVIHVRLHL